jgi:phytoene dehydrogenase-like protein
MDEERHDVAVVGAGFGGLGAAFRLAERGARVVLLERLRYPGGCACTFQRAGYAFDAGATLSSGLGDDQLFGRWRRQHALDFDIDWMDPVMTLRAPGLEIPTKRDKSTLVDHLCALAPDDSRGIRAFFREQDAVAQALWPTLEDPRALPPFRLQSLPRTARNLPRLFRGARWLGRPLGAVLSHYGVDRCAPLRLLLDALCQITVQCSAAEAEAPVAMSAIDYAWRGTGHVSGGIGELAWALWRGVTALGGQTRGATGVRSISKTAGGWRLSTRNGELSARAVVLNLLPQDAVRLVEDERARAALARRAPPLTDAWGAVTMYAGVLAPHDAADSAHHLQLVADPSLGLIEGNHVFASLSAANERGRAPRGERALTLSTHVDANALSAASGEEQKRKVEEIQRRMLETFAARAPEWAQGLGYRLPGSPRTFARFTGRSGGLVGGQPRRAGLLRNVLPRSHVLGAGLYLVGDSVLLGQSTYACALGGVRVADEILEAEVAPRRAA